MSFHPTWWTIPAPPHPPSPPAPPPSEHPPPPVIMLTNCRFLSRTGEVESGPLWLEGGRVSVPRPLAPRTEIDLGGRLVTAGLIDLQLNGGFGLDFTTVPGSVVEVARGLPRYGCTAFLATTITSSPAHYQAVLPTLHPRPGGRGAGAEVLGVHAEGPLISRDKKGAHDPALIVEDGRVTLGRALGYDREGALPPGLRMVTLAPELPGMDAEIRSLASRGVVVAVGHTAATYEQTARAVACGATMATHLFNAMEPLLHRNPNCAGYCLAHQDIYFSVIADGHHLHPAIIKLALGLRPEGLVLVTDAMSAMGLPVPRDDEPPLHLKLVDLDVVIRADGTVRLKDTGVLAGSILTLDAAVRNLRAFTGCSLHEAISAASARPAKVIGVYDRKGSIEIGKDADLVVWSDDNLTSVDMTFCAGVKVFERT
jgi:N-acetylglucosamine-6-phosphate deacetylase